jgi:hypothetical protein
MKKFVLLSAFLLTVVAAKTQTTNLVGKWVFVEEGDSLYFEFTKDSLLYIFGTGVEGSTESVSDFDTIGGRNFAYETDDDEVESVYLDFTYKTIASKPNHLYYVLYYTGTKKPYLIMPIMLKQQDNNTITLHFLTAKSDHSDEDGILYQSTADWQLADNTITAALAGDNSIAYDKYILTRLKKK